jgi:hypothetical protein
MISMPSAKAGWWGNRGEWEMRIEKVLAAPGLTGFYFDDQLAIKKGARADSGYNYTAS